MNFILVSFLTNGTPYIENSIVLQLTIQSRIQKACDISIHYRNKSFIVFNCISFNKSLYVLQEKPIWKITSELYKTYSIGCCSDPQIHIQENVASILLSV